MDLKQYISELPDNELETYAKACETSVAYMRGHIKHARRRPIKDTLVMLAENSGGKVTYFDVLDHFLDIDKQMIISAGLSETSRIASIERLSALLDALEKPERLAA